MNTLKKFRHDFEFVGRELRRPHHATAAKCSLWQAKEEVEGRGRASGCGWTDAAVADADWMCVQESSCGHSEGKTRFSGAALLSVLFD